MRRSITFWEGLVMDDLKALNSRILNQMGTANVNLHAILELVPVCLGRLKPDGRELTDLLSKLSEATHENMLDVTSINREYLGYARQTARDITTGYFDGLVILNIDLCQARALARLTNQQIAELSRRWPGTIFEVGANFHRSVQELHAAAVPHYSAAILAAAA